MKNWKERGAMHVPAYGFGFLGALVYFLQRADTFWQGVEGIAKALVWPAVIVYHLLIVLAR